VRSAAHFIDLSASTSFPRKREPSKTIVSLDTRVHGYEEGRVCDEAQPVSVCSRHFDHLNEISNLSQVSDCRIGVRSVPRCPTNPSQVARSGVPSRHASLPLAALTPLQSCLARATALPEAGHRCLRRSCTMAPDSYDLFSFRDRRVGGIRGTCLLGLSSQRCPRLDLVW
jgi:hypothetical protein